MIIKWQSQTLKKHSHLSPYFYHHTFITILFTIVLPHLYIFGFAYEAGYLNQYGINNELFSRSVPEYLTSSLLFFLNTMGFTAEYFFTGLAAIFFGFILLAAFILIADSKSEVLLKKPIKWLKKIEPYLIRLKEKLNNFNYKILAQPAKVAFILFSVLYGMLCLMVYASAITLAPYFVGKKVASDEIKKAPLCKLEQFSKDCVQIMEHDNVIASGKIITNSDKYLAVYNDGKATIYSKNDYAIVTKTGFPPSRE